MRRVCQASITGETLSAGEGHETGIWVKQIWKELTGKEIDIRIVVDSEGLSTNCKTTRLPTQRRLRIDLACLRQGLKRGEFVLTRVPSGANLSDPLTKARVKEVSGIVPPCDKMKRALLLALRTNRTPLSGCRSITKTQADACRY